ncbi:ROK family transcriptional regulator [Petropleomorpha daqingensis]|uniref:Glucokinase-like ROK family protein n=1 Tax=Petropleomorpha daqingensis TaxID=2026353 RepID=A0A853CM06_9ACTN|nr:glucokinase-like ROK family protein [Petropleomorpha daqingensis]
MPSERMDSLAAVLAAIRGGSGMTQPLLTQQVGLGRSVVAARIAELEAAGLVTQAGMGPSTGGRAPRQLRLRAEAGVVVGADIGATHMNVGIADLAGQVIGSVNEPMDIADGPEVVLSRVEQIVDELRAAHPDAGDVWGVGVGVPGPVEFSTGLPVAPPIMPGWDGYPIRQRMSRRFGAPTWVDNDVNLLALGELRSNPHATDAGDVLFVKIGTGIGAGLVSRGRLHRGANGCAGDIGHVAVAEAENVICRCGNTGCLEAVAGGAALAREGRRLAESGGSPVMAELLAAEGSIGTEHVTVAAERGDPAARALLAQSGRLVGSTLATLVSFYNPSLVVLGGGVVLAGDFVLAAVREAVYRRSLPLATRTLQIEFSSLGELAGLSGAVHLVLDELFAPSRLAQWLPRSSPAGNPELAAA